MTERDRPASEQRRGATFASLRVRNYRLYFTGQAISLVGTWMQSVSLSWLVLELAHSGTMIGLVVATQFLPVLVLGAYGGLIADRVSKRPLLIGTQSALGSLALLLGVLTVTHSIRLWMIFTVPVLLGTVQAADNPTRQTFVMEMVGADRVQNVNASETSMSAGAVISAAVRARAVGARPSRGRSGRRSRRRCWCRSPSARIG